MARQAEIADTQRLKQINSVDRGSDDCQGRAVGLAIVGMFVRNCASERIEILHDFAMSIREQISREKWWESRTCK
jgi:hypothetical protein